MATDHIPILAVTLGDPAGIGPELVARTLADPPTDPPARAVAVGDARALQRAVDVCGLRLRTRPVASPGGARFEPGTVDVLDTGVLHDDPPWGQVSADAGRAAVAAVEVAAMAALHREVDAVVTAPIHKEAIWAAGSRHLGHTELLGELTGSDRFNTMFVVRGLKIFFTTRHVGLREALDGITRATVLGAIRDSWTALRVLGHDEPTLAVAAVNPHAGEGGRFGDEEVEHVGPACEDARAEGIPVVGPVPADAVFHQGLDGRYDAVLSHFHDQGHIAAKTVDFYEAVTVTVGLPIVRVSVDHGTAFDIAGTCTAQHSSMVAAYRAGATFAPYADRARAEYGGG